MDHLAIRPRLPDDCPSMGVSDVRYRDVRLDVKATKSTVHIALKNDPLDALHVRLGEGWTLDDSDQSGPEFTLDARGTYTFHKRRDKS